MRSTKNNLSRSFLNSVILLTGGTGSFGQAFVKYLLSKSSFKGVIRIFSRDEFKQYQMQSCYPDDLRLRFLIGDVRDIDRLNRAMQGVDIVIHAAALKHITVAEYNPFEVIKTNVLGSQNIIEASLNAGIKKAVLISSDKAVHPINLYGATKLAAEKIFIQGNVYSGGQKSAFSVIRYGNVLGSRGSVIPLFLKQKGLNVLTVTNPDMTRFWITLPEAVKFVTSSIDKMQGNEIFIPKLPSLKIIDLAKAIAPRAKIKIIGMKQGEKLHEELIATEESVRCKEYANCYVIIPEPPHWSKSQMNYSCYYPNLHRAPFSYCSNTNPQKLTSSKLIKQLNAVSNDV